MVGAYVGMEIHSCQGSQVYVIFSSRLPTRWTRKDQPVNYVFKDPFPCTLLFLQSFSLFNSSFKKLKANHQFLCTWNIFWATEDGNCQWDHRICRFQDIPVVIGLDLWLRAGIFSLESVDTGSPKKAQACVLPLIREPMFCGVPSFKVHVSVHWRCIFKNFWVWDKVMNREVIK